MFFKSIVRLLLLILSIFLTLLLAEMFLRLSPDYRRDDFAWMSKNVVLNNFGYREKQIDLIKKPGQLRIYTLGDSYTYGWYINDSSLTYSSLIEKELKNKLGEASIEVINASQPGFNLEESLNRLKTEGMLFSPDIVTLGINIYDLLDQEFAPKVKPNFFNQLRLYQLTLGKKQGQDLAEKTKRQLDKVGIPNSPQLIKTAQIIKQMNQLISPTGGRLILIIFPNYDPAEPNLTYQYKNFHLQLNKIAEDEKLTLIDPLDLFNQVENKQQLVLNPTDAHPSILAHKLLALKILEQIDFKSVLEKGEIKQKIIERRFSLGEEILELHSLISISSDGDSWVYFRKEFGLGVEKHVLSGSDRKLPFMADFLKTAAAFTHDGWPGAKIEYHFPGDQPIKIDYQLYDYPIVGVHQVTYFYRQNGASSSQDLTWSQLQIKKTNGQIEIKIMPLSQKVDFYRIIFDVGAKQLDIEKNKLVSAFKTEILSYEAKKGESRISLTIDKKIGSLPKFVSTSESSGYIWLGNEQKKVNLEKKDSSIEIKFLVPLSQDSKISLPISTLFESRETPLIKFL